MKEIRHGKVDKRNGRRIMIMLTCGEIKAQGQTDYLRLKRVQTPHFASFQCLDVND